MSRIHPDTTPGSSGHIRRSGGWYLLWWRLGIDRWAGKADRGLLSILARALFTVYLGRRDRAIFESKNNLNHVHDNNVPHALISNFPIMSLTNASPVEAAQAARAASRNLAILPTYDRNAALTAIHDALLASKDTVLEANARDLAAAARAADSGQLSQSLVKRLDLGKKGKYEDMLQGILDVRQLDDPSEA
jgi:hypothetical protein